MSNREPFPESEQKSSPSNGTTADPDGKSSEHRLLQVEERIAWLERHVVEQDRAMMEMAETLQRVKQELSTLRAASASSTAQDGAAGTNEDDRPPHY